MVGFLPRLLDFVEAQYAPDNTAGIWNAQERAERQWQGQLKVVLLHVLAGFRDALIPAACPLPSCSIPPLMCALPTKERFNSG